MVDVGQKVLDSGESPRDSGSESLHLNDIYACMYLLKTQMSQSYISFSQKQETKLN